MMEVIRREVSRREVRIKVKHVIQKQKKKERELILSTQPKTKQQKRK